MLRQLVVLGLVAAGGVIVAPHGERWLLRQPSCLAYIGMRRDPLAPRQQYPSPVAAVAFEQSAIAKPHAPYVVVTSQGGDADFTNVVVAVRSKSGWHVSEASQPFDVASQKLLPFERLPSWELDAKVGHKLDRLTASDCLFNEPAFVDIEPAFHLALGRGRTVYDGTYRTIEIDTGTRKHVVVQGTPAGVAGAIGELVTARGRGFLVRGADGIRPL